MSILELNNFLYNYRSNENLKPTHSGLGKNKGSFSIPDDKLDELHKLLSKILFKTNLDLTELNQPNTNIKIDLDFKHIDNSLVRKFDNDFIYNFIKIYNNTLLKYLKDSKEKMNAFIMTRDGPYKDNKGIIKDGIHIMYPQIICDYNIQEMIRLEVLETSKPLITQLFTLGFKDEPICKVIDHKVIQESGWFMYGCSKPNTQPYKIVSILDYDLNDITRNYSHLSYYDMIKLLSIRNHTEKECLELNEDYINDFSEYKASKLKKTRTKVEAHNMLKLKQESVLHSKNDIEDNELDNINKLVDLLDEKRATNYNTWLEVGFCLYNISGRLYDSWIDFSRKAPNFDENSCIEKWMSMKSGGNLGIGSLHLWAQTDNYNGYLSVMSNNIRSFISQSSSKTTSDISKVVYEMYKYKYKYCPTISGGTWYEFYSHRWRPCKQGLSLLKKIDKEVLIEYLSVINTISQQIVENVNNAEVLNTCMAKMKPLQEITYMLRDITHKKKYLEELKILFSDQDFESKLDANPYLIAFENGVYDLKLFSFRDGLPEDKITMSTGIDYCVFDTDHEYLGEINTFLSQIFVDEDLRNYVLLMLASCLEGMNALEKFYIWTGVGGNGKSKLVKLLEFCFGDYIKTVPTTLFTQKSKPSGNCTPETVRLNGVRIVTAQETNKNEVFNVALVKGMTGNDKIFVRGLQKDGFDMIPQFKIIFSCNHKPSGLDPDDEGTWRRLSISPFDSRFTDHPDPKNPYEFSRDNYLSDKLNNWKEPFMYLLIEAYKEYRTNGLVEPKCVVNATLDYMKSNDSLVEFISERVCEDVTSVCKLEETYREYLKWWTESGNRPSECPKRDEFKSALEKKWGKYDSTKGWKNRKLRNPDEIILCPLETGIINDKSNTDILSL